MIETRDFVVPHFNYVEILEKPVLPYFVTALSYAVFGVHELSTRLSSIVSALLGIGAVFVFTRRFFGKRAAMLSTLVLSTSVGYVFMGRFAMLDMLLTLFIGSAILFLAYASASSQKRWYYPAYVAMGLAFITKGLIGAFLPLAIFWIYLAMTGNLAEILRMRLVRGILIIALIFIPWGITISMQEPEFSYTFFMQHQLGRFASGSFGRRKPFWFYIPIVFLMSCPWSLYLPGAIRRGLETKDLQKKNILLLMTIWIAVFFIFFSLPKSKLAHYMLPITWPAAVLIGVFLDGWIEKSSKNALWIKITAGAGYAMLVLMVFIMIYAAPRLSTVSLARDLSSRLQKNDIVAIYGSPDHFSDFIFYLRKRVVIIGSDRGTITPEVEEDLESAELSKRWFLDKKEFARLFGQPQRRVYCLTDEDKLGDLVHTGLEKYTLVKKEHGKILLSN